jgi:hypothetical protein
LTRLTHALQKGQVKATKGITQLTRDTGQKVHTKYVENLSGTQPSMAADPLPVGVVSGELRSKAKSVQVNQYRVDEVNDAPHSGWIEHGTAKMAPRRPLGDAVQQVGEELPGDMGEVNREIWRE